MNRWRKAFTILAATAMGALALPAAATASTEPEPVQYVALGDSYASGVGAGDYIPDGTLCLRSNNAYSAIWADDTGADLDFQACGGAQIPDVYSSQIDALDEETDLVTISIGGNDVGFAGIMIGCTVLPDFACIDKVDKAEADGRDRVAGELEQLYADLDAAAPNATVVVMGYPKLFSEVTCSYNAGISVAEQRRINDGVLVMDSIIREAAEAQGFRYADPVPTFEGHGSCAHPMYVHGLRGFAPESYHPTSLGQSDGFLPAFETAL
ncbi:SGNH/GDSL hydrolase family protein [Salininema proteolyticum]|uniref:SGNH/GDSL hydrolase family protein n=1 Tax=Salininema proteolyticum TaxID=1607685 RepID=A0ABV8TVT4_9ACTN